MFSCRKVQAEGISKQTGPEVEMGYRDEAAFVTCQTLLNILIISLNLIKEELSQVRNPA